MKLSVWDDETWNYIRVKDNGIGFDPLATQYDGRTRIGMDETRKRLEALCRAKMTIHFTPGTGTEVLITIPKAGDKT